MKAPYLMLIRRSDAARGRGDRVHETLAQSRNYGSLALGMDKGPESPDRESPDRESRGRTSPADSTGTDRRSDRANKADKADKSGMGDKDMTGTASACRSRAGRIGHLMPSEFPLQLMLQPMPRQRGLTQPGSVCVVSKS